MAYIGPGPLVLLNDFHSYCFPLHSTPPHPKHTPLSCFSNTWHTSAQTLSLAVPSTQITSQDTQVPSSLILNMFSSDLLQLPYVNSQPPSKIPLFLLYFTFDSERTFIKTGDSETKKDLGWKEQQERAQVGLLSLSRNVIEKGALETGSGISPGQSVTAHCSHVRPLKS